ncbi:hypothetical protein H8D99_00520 [bacterium]|nr:hypothetical protein [bacterium]
MSRKLIISILVLSFALLDLLVVRQAQINTVNDMMQLHNAINNGNEQLNTLSIEIETACSPSQLNLTRISLEGFDGAE